MGASNLIRALLGLDDHAPTRGRQSPSRQGLKRGNWNRSPTKQYARGGPCRVKSAGEPQRPSRQVHIGGECSCSARPRLPVAHRIDGESLDSEWRICSGCQGRRHERVA